MPLKMFLYANWETGAQHGKAPQPPPAATSETSLWCPQCFILLDTHILFWKFSQTCDPEAHLGDWEYKTARSLGPEIPFMKCTCFLPT